MRRSICGLTLIEVVVAGSLLIVLSMIFAGIFGQTRSSTEGGAEKLAMRATHRETQARLSRLLRSAMAPTEIDPAIVEPEFPLSSERLRFHAPSDLIDPDQVFNPRIPSYPVFLLERDSQTGGLLLGRQDGTGPKQLLGRGFSSVTFGREVKRIITIDLVSERVVRGAAGSAKTIKESTTNAVQIPGVR